MLSPPRQLVKATGWDIQLDESTLENSAFSELPCNVCRAIYFSVALLCLDSWKNLLLII